MKINFDLDYYGILKIPKNAKNSDIKKSYRKLSFIHHPDKNGDENLFNLITESYKILIDDKHRKEYDLKSKYGLNYDEFVEIYKIDIEFDYEKEQTILNKFKKNEMLDIFVKIDENFNGTVEYNRWIRCNHCDGTGRDLSSKIKIKDDSGKVIKILDGECGCDFCEGSGIQPDGNPCGFCSGSGKIGMTPCSKCNGEKRIYGNQKVNNIKLTGEKTILKSLGNCSKSNIGKTGSLIILKNEKK
jgi:DnaJ-class molecular chaperone